jgi:hypothetical protein
MPSANRYYNNKFGEHGEKVANRLLEERGFSCEVYGGTAGFDLLVDERVTVDVKAATCGGPGGRRGYSWQFNLKRHNIREVEGALLLLCFADPEDDDPIAEFVIPGGETAMLRKINITSKDPRTYSGKWSQYRAAWHVLNDLVESSEPYQEEEIPF